MCNGWDTDLPLQAKKQNLMRAQRESPEVAWPLSHNPKNKPPQYCEAKNKSEFKTQNAIVPSSPDICSKGELDFQVSPDPDST